MAKVDVLAQTNKPKDQYKLTNWPEYNAGLKRRGSLKLWIDESVSLCSRRAGRKASYNHACKIQNTRSARAKLVSRPEYWLYSSARNYAEGQSIYEVNLLWTDFDEDGGWFLGNVDCLVLD